MIKFLSVRVLLCSVVLAVLAYVISGYDWVTSAGVLTGGVISVYKVRLSSILLHYVTQNQKNTSLKAFMISLFLQMLTFAVLLVAVLIHVRFFYALTAGLLLTAAVICLNGITERIGLTHNHWVEFDEKEKQ